MPAPATLIALDTTSDLDAAIAASADHPVVIFKHSLTCGTSAMAAEEIMDLRDRLGDAADIRLLIVQKSRDVSWDAERRLKVRHESPQVLILSGGQVVWHASHFRVTAKAVGDALAVHSR